MRGAKRRGNPHPPSPKAPLCKGSCHGFAVTEGLPGVAGYFGDDLCSDSRPSLATAAHTLRCAPLARVVDAASLSPRKGRCPHRPVAKHHLWRFRRAGCDYTPPSCSAPPVGGGLRPAPLARSVFLPISVGSEYLPISRRGGPMCPPGHAFLRDPPTGRHAGRPLQILHLPPSKPGGDGAPPLPVPPKPSINPGKTECLSENPQTNSPFSILNYPLSIPPQVYHNQLPSPRRPICLNPLCLIPAALSASIPTARCPAARR